MESLQHVITLQKNPNEGSHRNSPSSAAAFFATLIPSLVQFAVLVTAFLVLRRKERRVYAPRTYIDSIPDDEKTPIPDHTFVGWIRKFRDVDDEYILNHHSLDGYLLIRFFKIVIGICFVGCCITWPILLPVNATGGGGEKQFNRVAFGNVRDPARYFAHALIAWVFLGFVMFTITRETIYLINLRQAYLLSPWNASRLSTRTILFTSVPREYRNEERLRRIFSSVNQIWLEPNYKDLEGMVEDRDSTALKLEEAEIQLSRDANKRRLKAMKNKDTGHHGAAESDNRRWLDKKERPTHRLTPIIGKKVDTIDYCRRRLSKLLPKIDASRRTRLGGNHKLVNAVFIEFETQAAAQAAFTMVVHNKPESMVPRQIAVPPKEIVWKNLRMTAYEANVRWILATGLICAMVLFWSIPVSLVGVLSNINYLAEKVPFLRFVDNLPSSVLGVITGLLPTILLAALLALVPMIFRFLAEQTGAVTRGEIELQTQYWYFGFQIIQVFLVTTLSSGAASVASQIASNPTSVTELLARNLPKASNFYITYFVLYGVGISASYLINFGGLVTFVLGRFTANTPRAMFTDYVKLTAPRWGSEYPKWTNLGVIAITYSCIAPLVLGFATVGMGLIYGAYRYNMFFVYNTDIDTRGASYAMALQQLTVGVYLAELCLIGLFAIRLGSSLWSSGPLLLTILLLVVTILYHYLMNQALGPLVQLLPQNLLAESEVPYDATLAGAESGTPRKHSQSANSSSSEHGQADADDSQASNAQDTIAPVTINDISTLHKDRPKPSIFHRYFSPAGQSAADIAASLHPRFRRPVPPYPADVARKAYLNPVMTSEPPVLWIVHDEMGISEEEVRETGKVVRITDEGAWFDERNRVVWDKERVREMPIWKDELQKHHPKLPSSSHASSNNDHPPNPTPLSFPAPIFAVLQPSSFLRAHLAPDSPSQPSLRANGRRPSEFRKPHINTGSLTHSHGSAVVRIGDTAVVAGVRGEILLADDIPNPPEREKREFDANSTEQAPPGSTSDSDRDNDEEGDAEADADSLAHLQLLVPNLELSTGCHPSHLPGSPPSTLAQSLTQRILSLLHSTRLVPLHSLRILRPKVRSPDLDDEGDEMLDPDAVADADGEAKKWEVVAYWTLYIDILFISLDGAAFDAAWGAVVAALGDTRLPQAWWDADRECVLCAEDVAQARGLGLRGLPVAATVGVFAPGKRGLVGAAKGDGNGEESWVLVDLDAFEEGLCREVVTVVVDCSGGGRGKIRRVEKNGGVAVGMARMREIVRSAEERWRDWSEVLGQLQR